MRVDAASPLVSIGGHHGFPGGGVVRSATERANTRQLVHDTASIRENSRQYESISQAQQLNRVLIGFLYKAKATASPR
jgi:hypothetical protein